MSTNGLKLLALICMLIDHIGEFMPQSPVWFRYVGRLSAPLFFFCSAWGFYYTHDRKKYLIRLYVAGLLMGMGNIAAYCFVGNGNPISNNIFVTLFLGCTIVFLCEKADTLQKGIRYFALFVVQQLLAFILCAIFAEILEIPKFIGTYMLYHSYGALFGSIIFTEGSVAFVLFFVALYYLKDKPVYLSGFVAAFSGMLGWLVRRTYHMRGPALYVIPFDRYQWMMLLAIPLFFLYNGNKGKNFKWFYYLFYPLHIWVLYIVGNCFKKI